MQHSIINFRLLLRKLSSIFHVTTGRDRRRPYDGGYYRRGNPTRHCFSNQISNHCLRLLVFRMHRFEYNTELLVHVMRTILHPVHTLTCARYLDLVDRRCTGAGQLHLTHGCVGLRSTAIQITIDNYDRRIGHYFNTRFTHSLITYAPVFARCTANLTCVCGPERMRTVGTLALN